MAVISTDTFDPLRRYVRVRLQQGVPIVDADVNEREDIQKFELRAFLKWFVGDGVPDGNDGFRIAGTGADDDFEIRAGVSGTVDPLRRIGRCLVDGLDVMIESTVAFTAQRLHESHGAAAAAEAARLGVPTITALPAGGGPVLVYLDVWERLVTPSEDPALVHGGLGTESCARIKREWAVRARRGAAPPGPGDPDVTAGHSYTPLASLDRRPGDAAVRPGDVTDLRRRRLLLPPATLIEDVLGTRAEEYLAGRGRPPISLREAVNALLRGELPTTPDAAVDASTALDVMRRAFFADATGGLVAFWYSDRTAGVEQVFAARMSLAEPSRGFTAPPLQVTSGTAHLVPHAAGLPDGDALVVYQSGSGAGADVMMRRAPLAGLPVTAEVTVTATAGSAETNPFVAVTGDLATVFFHLSSSTASKWQYRRWRLAAGEWADAAGAVELSATPSTASSHFHAAGGRAGTVWAVFKATGGLRVLQLDPATGTVSNETTLASDSADPRPFLLASQRGEVWAFWASSTGLQAALFRSGAWEAAQTLPGTSGTDRQPCAVEDADGGLWVFWTRGFTGSGDLSAMRRDPARRREPPGSAWGEARRLTASVGDDNSPHALVAPDGAIWIFWSTDRDGNASNYYKRLVTVV
ncbi:hypothetical protein AGRA3207_002098 [Actinomadura graeca]|uniref:Uncharacterized protein n=1 Tax=Actinomadura graeca TaxID=2750812 RepID=A0ABX8QR30_9ACTN|nr:DUF6519 domain-containing protein [Actinomadura graeca]QXJ21261.1 hypothetical protein AGRA3207_002098 [Actinomadura graeca]